MDTLCGLEFKLSVPSFYQVNRDQAEVLYSKALEFADLTGTETVLDLYCGIGTIGCAGKRAGRARRGDRAEAVKDAEENAAGTHENAGSSAATRGVVAKLEAEGLGRSVMDPPRKGLAPEVIAAMAHGAGRVVYVSCDPGTLGRDWRSGTGLPGHPASRWTCSPAPACGDGCLAFQGRGRLEKDSG